MPSYKRIRSIATSYGVAIRPKKKTKRAMPASISRMVSSSWTGPVPPKMSTTLRYVEAFALNPALSSNAQYVFSANGLFDPNITGIGHQPRGFDEMMKFYGNYCVKGCRITIQSANNGTAMTSENIVISCYPSVTNASTVTNIWDAIEPKGCAYYTFCPGTTITTTKPNYKLSNYVNVAKWMGQATSDDNTLKGDGLSNPSVQLYWILNCFCDGTSDVTAHNFIVELEYYVEFTRNTGLFAS